MREFFRGGEIGPWRVTSVETVVGAPLDRVNRLAILPEGDAAAAAAPVPGSAWVLQGVRSNVRYATRNEVAKLRATQAPLGRAEARRAALIPIRKSAAWWALAQDERRAIFEEQSHHNGIGMEYLPAIARQLYHCRDLAEPFDFLTWFDFAAEHETAFNHLVAKLREGAEWTYVDREVDIRLVRDP